MTQVYVNVTAEPVHTAEGAFVDPHGGHTPAGTREVVIEITGKDGKIEEKTTKVLLFDPEHPENADRIAAGHLVEYMPPKKTTTQEASS